MASDPVDVELEQLRALRDQLTQRVIDLEAQAASKDEDLAALRAALTESNGRNVTLSERLAGFVNFAAVVRSSLEQVAPAPRTDLETVVAEFVEKVKPKG